MYSEIANGKFKKLSEESFAIPSRVVDDTEIWLLVPENAMRQHLFRLSIFDPVGSDNLQIPKMASSLLSLWTTNKNISSLGKGRNSNEGILTEDFEDLERVKNKTWASLIVNSCDIKE